MTDSDENAREKALGREGEGMCRLALSLQSSGPMMTAAGIVFAPERS